MLISKHVTYTFQPGDEVLVGKSTISILPDDDISLQKKPSRKRKAAKTTKNIQEFSYDSPVLKYHRFKTQEELQKAINQTTENEDLKRKKTLLDKLLPLQSEMFKSDHKLNLKVFKQWLDIFYENKNAENESPVVVID